MFIPGVLGDPYQARLARYAPVPMDETGERSERQAAFPRAGSRARRWMRFERDFTAWLRTPQGRFAAWDARRTCGATPGSAQR